MANVNCPLCKGAVWISAEKAGSVSLNHESLRIWLKEWFWRNSKAEWTKYPWAKKWGNPFVAYQSGEISIGKLTEILAEEIANNYKGGG